MEPLQDYMVEYRAQLQKGGIQKAYKGLMDYMSALKTFFKNKYPHYAVPGSLYNGYMDMTYFSIVPDWLQAHNLKIAIVFLHEAFRFEVWLAGYNKQVQAETWQFIMARGWNAYRLVPTIKGADSVLEHILVDQPDFNDLDGLTRQIERETIRFIEDVERFFASEAA